jgi:hypothetical protein
LKTADTVDVIAVIAPAGITWTTVKPAECVTGVVDSEPRVTVHVVPDTFVTRTTSDGAAGSATWNFVAGVTVLDAAGKDADDVTVHVSWVPPEGALVPPLGTVVAALFAYSSSAIRPPGMR